LLLYGCLIGCIVCRAHLSICLFVCFVLAFYLKTEALQKNKQNLYKRLASCFRVNSELVRL